jgi:hypothetical protein
MGIPTFGIRIGIRHSHRHSAFASAFGIRIGIRHSTFASAFDIGNRHPQSHSSPAIRKFANRQSAIGNLHWIR